jgi:DNA repair exonuclease SbcCD ATPase subunit/DNA repair exonuclease SbcCD nuclease subunit
VNKLAVISDIHAHDFAAFAHKTPEGLNSRLVETIKALDAVAARCHELGVSKIAISGDLFHIGKRASSEVLTAVSGFFQRHHNLTFFLIPGNHDYSSEDSNIHVTSYLRGYSNVCLYDEAKVVSFGKTKATFIPFIRREDELKRVLDTYRPKAVSGPNILFCHTGISGVPLSSGVVLNHGVIDPICFLGWGLAIAGHYHEHTSGNFTGGQWLIPGSLLQVDLSEEGQSKGFVCIDLDTLKWCFEEIESPRFKTIRLPSQISELEEIKNKPTHYLRLIAEEPSVTKFAVAELMKGACNPYVFKKFNLTNRATRLDLNLTGSLEPIIDKYVDHINPAGLDHGILKKMAKDLVSQTNKNNYRGASPIVFKRLVIENFRSIEHADIPLDQPGLYLIVGENLDGSKPKSNGSGKTSIVEAFCYALTGKTVRGVSGDRLIRRGSKGLHVRLVFTDPTGREVEIDRYRAHETWGDAFWLSIEGKKVTQHKKVDTQTELSKITGINEEVMAAVDIITPKSLFLGLGDTVQKSVVEALLGFDNLSEARDIVSDEMRALERLQIEKATGIKNDEISVTSCASRIKSLLESKERSDKVEEERLKSLDHQLIAYGTQRVQSEEKIKILSSEIEGLRGQKDSLNLQYSQLTPIDLNAKIQETRDFLKTLSINGEFISQDIDKTKKVMAKIRALKAGETCECCGQVITADSCCSYLQRLEDQIHDKREELSEITDMESASAEILKTDLATQQAYTNEKTRLTGLMKDADSKILSLETRVLLEQSNLSSIISKIKLLEDSRLNVKPAQTIEPILEREEKELDRLTQILESDRITLEETRKSLGYKAFWDHGFSPNGLRSYIFDVVTPQLNDSVTETLSSLTENLSLSFASQKRLKTKDKLKDAFQVSVASDGGIEDYSQASAGEAMLLEIATTTALRSLRAINRSDHNIMVFDESLDCIDDVGFGDIVTFLRDKAEEANMTIMVVSHNAIHRDLFDKRIKVTKKNKVSRVEFEC